MALLTPLPLASAQNLAARYGVDTCAVTPLRAGSVNSNFELLARDGSRFFARLYEEQGLEGAAREVDLLKRLSAAGVPVVRALEHAQGGVLEHAGKAFALFPWVDGELVCQTRVTEGICHEVGAALAALHRAAVDATWLSKGRFRLSDMKERLALVERTAPPELANAAHGLRQRATVIDEERLYNLPSGVIHGDLFRDNVFFREGKLQALIDFESASRGPFAYDLMVTILAWCFSDRFELDLVRALALGYHAARPLLPEELEHCVAAGALACLRFATTRITDFSLRTPAGQQPARDFRRFLARWDALDAGALNPVLAELQGFK